MNLATAAEFHAEIERLQGEIERPCPCVVGTTTKYCVLSAPTLTDAEREAVEWFAAGDETCYGWGWMSRAATLRGLLERLK